MEDIDNQLLLNLLSAAMSNGSIPFTSNSYNQGNPFEVQGLQGLMPEEDSFFGPIGAIFSQMVPGLSTTGIDGSTTPIFKSNFRTKQSGLSGFQHLVAAQNKAAFSRATSAQQQVQNQGYSKLFGDGSAIQKLIDATPMSQSGKDNAHALVGLLNSPMAANIVTPLISQMLGYDRGVSASMAGMFSPQMLSSFATSGAYIDNVDDNGGFFDPFSEASQRTRSALETVVATAPEKMMYNGAVKKENIHGASQALVTKIIADGISSGAFADGGDYGAYDKDGNFIEDIMNRPSFAQDLNDLRNAQTDLDTATAQQAEFTKAKEYLSKRENKGKKYKVKVKDQTTNKEEEKEYELKEVEGLIQGKADQINKLTSEIDQIEGKISQAMEPLVESVTGVVSSLKTF